MSLLKAFCFLGLQKRGFDFIWRALWMPRESKQCLDSIIHTTKRRQGPAPRINSQWRHIPMSKQSGHSKYTACQFRYAFEKGRFYISKINYTWMCRSCAHQPLNYDLWGHFSRLPSSWYVCLQLWINAMLESYSIWSDDRRDLFLVFFQGPSFPACPWWSRGCH